MIKLSIHAWYVHCRTINQGNMIDCLFNFIKVLHARGRRKNRTGTTNISFSISSLH